MYVSFLAKKGIVFHSLLTHFAYVHIVVFLSTKGQQHSVDDTRLFLISCSGWLALASAQQWPLLCIAEGLSSYYFRNGHCFSQQQSMNILLLVQVLQNIQQFGWIQNHWSTDMMHFIAMLWMVSLKRQTAYLISGGMYRPSVLPTH